MAGNASGMHNKLTVAVVMLMLFPLAAQSEFPNPGRYGGFVPPHELERLQNLNPVDPVDEDKDKARDDSHFAIDNDPWEALPSPFKQSEQSGAERERERPMPQRFISPREMEMLENPRHMMRFGRQMEPQNVWGDLYSKEDESSTQDEAQSPAAQAAPPASNYPYGGYAPTQPAIQPYVPGVTPGYRPGFAPGFAPGFGPGFGSGYMPGAGYGGMYPNRGYSNQYMYPGASSPYMTNSIAPFLFR